jgi:hypothetical protein
VTGQDALLGPREVRGESAIDYRPHVDPGPGAILAAPFIVLLFAWPRTGYPYCHPRCRLP